MKTKLKPRIYKFETNTQWTQARKGLLASVDKDQIEFACPPEFGGHHGYWTAEHLFVASIEICIMTTFKWLFEKMGGELISYESRAVGIAQMVNGDFQFDEIEIIPVIIVAKDDLSKTRDAIGEADKQCLISKSLNFKVKVNPLIKTK